MLDLYDRKDHNVHQMAVALRRHRAQIAALETAVAKTSKAPSRRRRTPAPWMESQARASTVPTCCPAPKITRSLLQARVSTKIPTTTPSKREPDPWPTNRPSAISPSSSTRCWRSTGTRTNLASQDVSSDLVNQILEEGAKFADEVIAPDQQPIGDQGRLPLVWRASVVTGPNRLEGSLQGHGRKPAGWRSRPPIRAYGGQGMPSIVAIGLRSDDRRRQRRPSPCIRA